MKSWVTLSLTFQGHSKSNVTVPLGSPYMVSSSCLISNIGPNYAPLRDMLENVTDPDSDLSRSLKVKSSDAIGLPI